jgi:anti-sigma regulatory factor (Ser/Thr protein kinase)
MFKRPVAREPARHATVHNLSYPKRVIAYGPWRPRHLRGGPPETCRTTFDKESSTDMHIAAFEPVPGNAKAAREFVRSRLTDRPCQDQDLAVLLVSELATNAIIHVGRPFKVAVDLSSPARIWVGVDDPSPLQSEPGPIDITATGGRGLFLVAAMADRWGIEPTPAGKRAWFELLSRSL